MGIIEQLRTRAELLTLDQFAKILSCHRQTLYKRCAKSVTPHLHFGRRIKCNPFAVFDFLEKRSIG